MLRRPWDYPADSARPQFLITSCTGVIQSRSIRAHLQPVPVVSDLACIPLHGKLQKPLGEHGTASPTCLPPAFPTRAARALWQEASKPGGICRSTSQQEGLKIKEMSSCKSSSKKLCFQRGWKRASPTEENPHGGWPKQLKILFFLITDVRFLVLFF